MSDWYRRYLDWSAEVWSGRRAFGAALIPIAEIAADAEAEHAAEVAARKRRVLALTAEAYPDLRHHYVRSEAPPERLRAACMLAHGIAATELGLRRVKVEYCRPAFHDAEKPRSVAAFGFAVAGFTFIHDSTAWVNFWNGSPASVAAVTAHEMAHIKVGTGSSSKAASERFAQSYATGFWQRHRGRFAAKFGSALRVAA